MTTRAERSEAARILGRQSYPSRLRRLGREHLAEISRQNGRNGGRPRKETKRETV